MTLDQWEALDEDETAELVDGVLEEAEVCDATHEAVLGWLHAALWNYFRPRGGRVLGSALKVAVAARRGRMPDLSVFLTQQPPRRGLIRIPPDIVVEIVSPSPTDQRRDRIAKVADYAKFGVLQYWLVDPTIRTVEILALRNGVYAHLAGATEGTLEVPEHEGLTLDLDAIWAEVDALPED